MSNFLKEHLVSLVEGCPGLNSIAEVREHKDLIQPDESCPVPECDSSCDLSQNHVSFFGSISTLYRWFEV